MSAVAAARAGNASVPWSNQVKLLAVFLYFTAKILGSNNDKKTTHKIIMMKLSIDFAIRMKKKKSVHENVTKNSRKK